MNNLNVEILRCPRCGSEFNISDESITCLNDHSFRVIDNVPVFLLDSIQPTINLYTESLENSKKPISDLNDPWYTETLGLDKEERKQVRQAFERSDWFVDPVVSYLLMSTGGFSYKSLAGRVKKYPIPEIRLPNSTRDKLLLDIGCGWGRWSLAAAQKGYSVIGLDPSLGATLAAKRVSTQLNLNAEFVVGDARHLPLSDSSIDQIFSYSVLQHFSKKDAIACFKECLRVLKPGGSILVQMPNTFGIRCLYHQIKRFFRPPIDFEVRYWTVSELKKVFNSLFSEIDVSVDCFFGIGLQASDLDIMPKKIQAVIKASEMARKLSLKIPMLTYVADSVYICARKQ